MAGTTSGVKGKMMAAEKYSDLGLRPIQLALLRRRWTQRDLARECDVSEETVSRWCNGHHQPLLRHAYRLADLLDLTLDEVYG